MSAGEYVSASVAAAVASAPAGPVSPTSVHTAIKVTCATRLNQKDSAVGRAMMATAVLAGVQTT
jgi:hypothetical protein